MFKAVGWPLDLSATKELEMVRCGGGKLSFPPDILPCVIKILCEKLSPSILLLLPGLLLFSFSTSPVIFIPPFSNKSFQDAGRASP